jgi:phage shock protein C
MASQEEVKRIYKSRTERMIDGVCGGIAEYIGVDAVLVRIGFVLLAFAGGVGVLLYIVGMILMPVRSAQSRPAGDDAAPGAAETPAPKQATDTTARVVGVGFVVLGGLLLLGNLGMGFWNRWWGLSWGALAPLLVVAAGVALILRSPRVPAGSATAGGPEASSAPAGGSRLCRARFDRKFLGVCGGLGMYLTVDPTILRLLFVISAIASFGGTILLYLVTAIIIPVEPLAVRTA